MSGQSKARIHQRIPVELKEKIRREARHRHLDETSIVIIAVTEYFERRGEPPLLAEELDELRAEQEARAADAAE